MSNPIGEFITSGQLNGTRRNSVFGWIEFAPDYGVRIEWTGNLHGLLDGCIVRFHSPSAISRSLEPSEMPARVDALSNRQIGVLALCELVEFTALSNPQSSKTREYKGQLRIEWHGQDGHLLVEIADAYVTLAQDDRDFEPHSDERVAADSAGDSLGGAYLGDEIDEWSETDDEVDTDDPFGLFHGQIDQHSTGWTSSEDSMVDASGADPEALFPEALNAETSADDEAPESSSEQQDASSASELPAEFAEHDETDWRQASLDLDPATRAMYEQLDEIFDGKKDEPLPYLFETTLRLPRPEAVATDAEAWPLVVKILAELAKLSVVLDVCEHYTSVQTYRLLINEILANAMVHPNLAASEMVQHYSTSEYCQLCQAEFLDEYDSD